VHAAVTVDQSLGCAPRRVVAEAPRPPRPVEPDRRGVENKKSGELKNRGGTELSHHDRWYRQLIIIGIERSLMLALDDLEQLVVRTGLQIGWIPSESAALRTVVVEVVDDPRKIKGRAQCQRSIAIRRVVDFGKDQVARVTGLDCCHHAGLRCPSRTGQGLMAAENEDRPAAPAVETGRTRRVLVSADGLPGERQGLVDRVVAKDPRTCREASWHRRPRSLELLLKATDDVIGEEVSEGSINSWIPVVVRPPAGVSDDRVPSGAGRPGGCSLPSVVRAPHVLVHVDLRLGVLPAECGDQLCHLVEIALCHLLAPHARITRRPSSADLRLVWPAPAGFDLLPDDPKAHDIEAESIHQCGISVVEAVHVPRRDAQGVGRQLVDGVDPMEDDDAPKAIGVERSTFREDRPVDIAVSDQR